MSRQTAWTVDSPQGLEGMQNHYWKGEWPFFVGLAATPNPDPLWVEVPFEFVRGLALQEQLFICLDCGSAGTGLYVTPHVPWVCIGTDERKG